MSNIKKVILWVLILGVVAGGVFTYVVYQTIFADNTAFNNDQAHIYIESTAGFKDVKEELRPLLKDLDAFETVAEKKSYIGNIKAGHYVITKGMSNNDIINTLRVNNVPVTIRFNNQERLEDLAGRLAAQVEIDSLTLLEAMRDPRFLADKGFNQANALSMYLPNSYQVYWNTSPEGLREKMWKEYENFWNQERKAKAAQMGYTPLQISALAAIVQKETAKADERPRVAGVYVNRLKVGMPLQADPTVIYAKKLLDNDFQQQIKRVLYRDLELDSKFNTYKYGGIPPGPISMPDISSIDAVLNYEKHNYYYFVVNVENFGYHKFAESIEQHNRNRAAYVRWINEQGINR
ncbi:endolytic transglycosylase MltG [Gilvibacter sp.]|uniref:endolytic transglycosylase MltG n=1 Tax=Gilvibacter sp. TaxID=2729997 RepID=UPI003F4A5432